MPIKDSYDVLIVGAGLAGISTAIHLKAQGKTVLVIEKNSSYGGKLSEYNWQDFRWDKGPSLFTEPELVDELFQLCGKNPRDFFNYKQLNESCRYFFTDGQSIVFHRDRKNTKDELKQYVSNDDLKQLDRYMEQSETMFDAFGDFFLSRKKPQLKDLFNLEMIKRYPHFLKKALRTSLSKYNTSQFRSEKLIQIFNRYGTYNGSDPYQMSGLYAMIPHLEINKGSYFPNKGMRSIVDSLFSLSKELGVEYIFDSSIEIKLKNGSYQTKGTHELKASKVVCAIDHINFYKDVVKNQKLADKFARQERSSSGLVFYWAVNEKIEALGLHNILFSNAYQDEFEAIFKNKKLPQQPTIYIHNSSAVSSNDAPQDGQNWFIMINTPAGIDVSESERDALKQLIFTRIQQQFSIDISNSILHERHWDSKQIEFDTGAYLGALYGSSSNSTTSALSRHGNTSKQYPNLYFCGGTVHPGGGIPLVLRSSKIVSQLAL